MNIDYQLLLPMLLPWLLCLIGIVVIFVVARLKRWSRPVTGCLMMICCFGNTSFFGFPMVKAFFGETALGYAIVYDLFGSFLSLAIIGNIILALYAGDAPFCWRSSIRKIITFPPLIAIIIALLTKTFEYPDWLSDLFSVIATTLIPSTMFLVGMHMRFKIISDVRGPLQFGLGLKLVLLPLIAYGMITLFNEQDKAMQLVAKVSVFEAAMPPMVTASVLAIHARLKPELASVAVGLGLVASCISLSAWYIFVLA